MTGLLANVVFHVAQEQELIHVRKKYRRKMVELAQAQLLKLKHVTPMNAQVPYYIYNLFRFSI